MTRIASLSASLRVAAKMLRSSSAICGGSALLSGTSAIELPLSWSISNTRIVSRASRSSDGDPCTIKRCRRSSGLIAWLGGSTRSRMCCMSVAPTKRSGNTSVRWPAPLLGSCASGAAATGLPSLRCGVTRIMPSACTIVAPRLFRTPSRVGRISSRRSGRFTLNVTGPVTSGSMT